MCKDRIEAHLAFEKGVKKSEVDLEKDEVKITFNSKKTDLEKLRKSLSNLGYDADEVKADQTAYNKLPDCCKKPADQKEKGHDHKNCNHTEE
jgi:copper chaperone CopZ